MLNGKELVVTKEEFLGTLEAIEESNLTLINQIKEEEISLDVLKSGQS